MKTFLVVEYSYASDPDGERFFHRVQVSNSLRLYTHLHEAKARAQTEIELVKTAGQVIIQDFYTETVIRHDLKVK